MLPSLHPLSILCVALRLRLAVAILSLSLLCCHVAFGQTVASAAEIEGDKRALSALVTGFHNHDVFTSSGWVECLKKPTCKPCSAQVNNFQPLVFLGCNSAGRVTQLNFSDPIRIPALKTAMPFGGVIPWSNMIGLSELEAVDYTGVSFLRGPAFTKAIGAFTKLKTLIFVGCTGLTGTIPDAFTKLTKLEYVDLGLCALSGQLPQSGMEELSNMKFFHVNRNSFSGPLPWGMGAWKNATDISFGANSFSGTIPEWSNLTSLRLLQGGSNNLYGDLPSSFSSMKKLTDLDFSNNQLNGSFPFWITNLTSLQKLHLENNQMMYGLPTNFWTKLPNLTDVYLGNNYFIGEFPQLPSARISKINIDIQGNCFSLSQLQINASSFEFIQNVTKCVGKYIASPPPPPPQVPNTTYKTKTSSDSSSAIIIVASCIAVLIIILISAYIVYSRRSTNLSKLFSKDFQHNTREFSLAEMKAATKNWQTMVGKGGYGSVYKAELKDGTLVAVKRLDEISKQGDQEFVMEIELLSRVHHRHLVNLLGFCAERGERALVYEYMAMGSLYEHLHGPTGDEYPLSWEARIKIAIHIALGIEYLHYGADPPLIHRDIKSANVLLSDDGYAKVADFGLCKEAPLGAGPDGSEQLVPTATAVRGSFGYLDPEYVNTSVLSEKSDVYSYGVVLLELITGHKSIHEWQPLAYWADEYMKDRERTPQMVDPRVQGNFDMAELFALADIARTCVQDQSVDRPTIRDVAKALVENLGHSMSSYAGSNRDSASVISASLTNASKSIISSKGKDTLLNEGARLDPGASASNLASQQQQHSGTGDTISDISSDASSFSYQNYSESLHWAPGLSGTAMVSKSGAIGMSTGVHGDRLPVPVPKKPNEESDNPFDK